MEEEKRAELRRIVRSIKSLPTMPGVVLKLNAMADDEKATVQDIARLISSDQILSAKVLKLVNSPFYGFPRRVSTISNALVLLGVNVVKSLLLSSSIFEIMEKNVVGLWEHSLGTGVAANTIAKHLKLPEPEELSTAALLHDIGKVIIKIELKDDYSHLLSLIEEKNLSMRAAERELLYTDHAEIGEWLGKTWMLPDKLVEPIAFHHEVEKSVTHQMKTAAIHLADIIVKTAGFGFSGDDLVPEINPIAWKKLGLTEDLLEMIVEEVVDKLVETKNFSLEIQSTDGPKT